ncbi:glycoside hydrolase family 3 protein [Clostridium perfringens]|nr:glycoside hydrolase family 3 protein [Clostridium perfringens]
MNKFENLKKKPFNLNDNDIAWVEKTLNNMTLEEKIGQIFCLIAFSDDKEYLKNLLDTVKPGGIMCRPMPLEQAVEANRFLQENSEIPMLIAANLEKGGNGAVFEGTSFGSPMEIGATKDYSQGYRLGDICGAEGSAAGINWAFAPIIDIDYNFRNPITNTRTFGSDPEVVKNMGAEYVKAVQKYDMAASIKHFPGDGMDERDQHLVTSINSMSCEDWDKTYGEAYKASIEAGAKTVMVGHIMQPAYSRKLNPELKDREILPASLSPELVTGLLKEQLNFNGLVVTDASTMAGMIIPMPRAKAVPQAIAAGCDMFLFTRNLEEDYEFMKKGVEDGIITSERLDDAVTKVLGLKASLKLHHKKEENTLLPNLEDAKKVIGNEKHLEWAKECADKSITLVKEEKGVLPISPEKFKKVLLYYIGGTPSPFYGARQGVDEIVKGKLEKEGFEVDIFNPGEGFEGMVAPFSSVVGKYDLIIYVTNLATKSNQTIVRIEWDEPMGANVPVYMEMVPIIFISVENPYHLIDVPRVKTFINTYHSSDTVLDSLFDKLMGRSEFKGQNPVDPFCGMWDTRL